MEAGCDIAYPHVCSDVITDDLRSEVQGNLIPTALSTLATNQQQLCIEFYHATHIIDSTYQRNWEVESSLGPPELSVDYVAIVVFHMPDDRCFPLVIFEPQHIFIF